MEELSQELKDFDHLLVEMVHKFPILYNKQLRDYKNKNARDAAWSSIATVMSCEPSKCASRWSALRDSYAREAKKRSGEERSGCGQSNRRGFALFQEMSFLKQHYTERRAFSNVMYPSITPQLSSLNTNAVYFLPNDFSKMPQESTYPSCLFNSFDKQHLTPPPSVSPPTVVQEVDDIVVESHSTVVGKSSMLPENKILKSTEPEFELSEISTFPHCEASTSKTDKNRSSKFVASEFSKNFESPECAPPTASFKTSIKTSISSPTIDTPAKATSCYNANSMKRKKKRCHGTVIYQFINNIARTSS